MPYVSESTYGEVIEFRLHETREDAVSYVLGELPSEYDGDLWASKDGREIERSIRGLDFTVDVFDSVEEAICSQLNLDEETLPHILRSIADAVEVFYAVKTEEFSQVLKFKPHPNHPDGVRAVVNFPNGYGASVIKTSCSYGGPQGLYELAVLYKGDPHYKTPITDDVIGWKTPAQIMELLKRIEQLPRAQS